MWEAVIILIKCEKNSLSTFWELKNPYLYKLEFPSPMCQVSFKIGPVILEEKSFKFCQCIYAILLYGTFPWQWGKHYFWKKLESPSPTDATCQVWLKLHWCFWIILSNFVNVLSQFCYYLSLGKSRAYKIASLPYKIVLPPYNIFLPSKKIAPLPYKIAPYKTVPTPIHVQDSTL